jgi:hypothetical protein
MSDKDDPMEQLTQLALDGKLDDQELILSYLKQREELMGNTTKQMVEAMREGRNYQLLMTAFVSNDHLRNLFDPSDPLIPELMARVLADEIRDIALTNLQELLHFAQGFESDQ